jgi:signal peptidase I
MCYIITAVIIIVIFTFIISFHPIAGNSMTPSLEEGDIVIVNKFYPSFFDFKHFQIVIVKKESKTYIKRVIGLPGENVSYSNNLLTINDEHFKEPFLGDVTTDDFNFEDICDLENCPGGVILEDYYLVLGDNRNDSKDSRNVTFGIVHKSEIDGLSIFKIWPINDLGKI